LEPDLQKLSFLRRRQIKVSVKPFQRLAEREAAPHNKIDKSKGNLFEKFPFYS